MSSPAASAEERLSNASLSPSQSGISTPATTPSTSQILEPKPPIDILVAGALAVDFSCDYSPFPSSPNQTDPSPHTSNPAIIRQTLGGVAHNIAKAAHLVGSSVLLCSAVGDDLSGSTALLALKNSGMQTSGIQVIPNQRTAQYVAVNNANKDLAMAMADMSILETSTPASIQSTWIGPLSHLPQSPKCVVVDANWDASSLHTWLTYARFLNAFSIFEPVSTAKATRLLDFPPTSPLPSPFSSAHPDADGPAAIAPPLCTLSTPNTHELLALHDYAAARNLFETPAWFRVIDALGIPSSGLRVPLSVATTPAIVDAGIPQMAIKLLPFVPTLLVKLGSQGVLVVKLLKPDAEELYAQIHRPYVLARKGNGDEGAEVGGLYVRLFGTERVLKGEEVVSVNGIGDTFAGVLAAALVGGRTLAEAVSVAQKAAGLSLQSAEAVSGEVGGLRALVQGGET